MYACSVTQWCLTLCKSIDCSPLDSSVHRIFQASILECVVFSPPRHLPNPGIKPMSPASPTLAGRLSLSPGKPNDLYIQLQFRAFCVVEMVAVQLGKIVRNYLEQRPALAGRNAEIMRCVSQRHHMEIVSIYAINLLSCYRLKSLLKAITELECNKKRNNIQSHSR